MRWWEAALAYVIGPGVVGAGTWFAAKVASKGSVHAADRSAEVARETGAVEGYHKLVADLQADMTRLRGDLNNLQTAHDELADEVKHLRHEEIRAKATIRQLVGYCRKLRRQVVKLGGHPSDPPGGLDFDDPLTDPSLP